MKADSMLIAAIYHMGIRSEKTDRASKIKWKGSHYNARENIESISPNSLPQHDEDECVEIWMQRYYST